MRGRMIRSAYTCSLADFQRNAGEHIQRLRHTGRPSVLTIDGDAAIVVQDATAYQEMLDRLDRAEAIVGIHRGLRSMRRGEGIPAKEAFDVLRRQLGIDP
jgi:seryl-tRNA(Sec) selenium transferase